jgi:hypothetical protein
MHRRLLSPERTLTLVNEVLADLQLRFYVIFKNLFTIYFVAACALFTCTGWLKAS